MLHGTIINDKIVIELFRHINNIISPNSSFSSEHKDVKKKSYVFNTMYSDFTINLCYAIKAQHQLAVTENAEEAWTPIPEKLNSLNLKLIDAEFIKKYALLKDMNFFKKGSFYHNDKK